MASYTTRIIISLQWRHNERDFVSNHQPHDCLLNRLFRRRSKKTWKLRITGLCAENSPGTGEFPAQIASNTENVSIWWRHHVIHCNLHCFHQHYHKTQDTHAHTHRCTQTLQVQVIMIPIQFTFWFIECDSLWQVNAALLYPPNNEVVGG